MRIRPTKPKLIFESGANTELWWLTSYRNHAGKRAFLVNVATLYRSLRCPEAQSDIFVESTGLADTLALSALRLAVEEDVRLLLKGALALHLVNG